MELNNRFELNNMDKNEIMKAIYKMAEDDNQGLRISITVVDVRTEERGDIVGFGVEKQCGDSALLQSNGLPAKHLCCAFFIDTAELEKYR